MSGTQASKLAEVLRERFGTVEEAEKERDQPILPPTKRGVVPRRTK